MKEKEQWGSHLGFLLASIGAAVGLGNLWGFPYKMGVSGGFAFLIIYIALAILVGFATMTAELVIGRKTRKGALLAYRDLKEKYAFVGWLPLLASLFFLSFYVSLGGYCIKYAVANFGDIIHAPFGVGGADPTAYFEAFTQNPWSVSIFAIIFMAITVLVVMGGVEEGIEKFSTITIPVLFGLLCIVIIRSLTLDGAMEGVKFMFQPDFSVFKGTGWISILSVAGAQMFFSLSLGFGVILTYGSYLSEDADIGQSALIIPAADTAVAILAGLAVMPAVFSMGMEPSSGPGLLFMTLQGVFANMGVFGPFFGFVLYLLVLIAALSSSIPILEVPVAAYLDHKAEKGKEGSRNRAAILFGVLVGIMAVIISVDGLGTSQLPHPFGLSLLDLFDFLSEGTLMPLASFFTCIIVGWVLGEDWLEKEITKHGNPFRFRHFTMICLKYIAPISMLLIILGQVNSFFSLGLF